MKLSVNTHIQIHRHTRCDHLDRNLATDLQLWAWTFSQHLLFISKCIMLLSIYSGRAREIHLVNLDEPYPSLKIFCNYMKTGLKCCCSMLQYDFVLIGCNCSYLQNPRYAPPKPMHGTLCQYQGKSMKSTDIPLSFQAKGYSWHKRRGSHGRSLFTKVTAFGFPFL